MKYLVSVIFLAIVFLNSFAVNDHFPTAQGNVWLFTYQKTNWAWEDSSFSLTVSGTMKWEIVSVASGMAVSSGVTNHIIIRRTTSINRRTASSALYPGSGYDSIFNPPRVSTDSFSMTGNNQATGVSFLGDTCWSFVHDPKASIPAGKLTIRDTTVSRLGKTMEASIIDPTQCRGFSETELGAVNAES